VETGKTLEQEVQEAIYRVRWVDSFKAGTMATDEAITKAVVRVIDERGL
jgi:hypothetical protein